MFAKIRRRNDEDTALALGPTLRNYQSCFDGFTKPNLVGQKCAFGQWRSERKECRINLMRIHIHLRACNCDSKLLATVRGAAACQVTGNIFRMIICNHIGLNVLISLHYRRNASHASQLAGL